VAGPGTILPAALLVLVAWSPACLHPTQKGNQGWDTDDQQAERECQSGALPACRKLGISLIKEARPQKDFERGLVLLETTCGQEDWPACEALGGWYLTRKNGQARAIAVLERACSHGLAKACTGKGKGLKLLEPASPDEIQAAFQAGCEKGDAEGCDLLARTLWQDDFQGDPARALAAMGAACNLGRRESCHALGMAWLSDPARQGEGWRLLDDNCGRDHWPSCVRLALQFAPLASSHPDCARALPYARRLCSANDTDGCAIAQACALTAGMVATDPIPAQLSSDCGKRNGLSCLYWADFVAQTPEAAARRGNLREAYRIACAKSPVRLKSCARVAILDLAEVRNGEHAKDLIQRLHQLCDRGEAEACCHLGGEFLSGARVSIDKEKGERLRSQACEQGAKECCLASPVGTSPAKAPKAP
jgi:TPR repeat protein